MENRLVIFGLLLLCLMGCQAELELKSGLIKKSGKALVVTTTNYQTGALAILDLDSRLGDLKFASIHHDAMVKFLPEINSFLVINRFGADNLQFIEKNTGNTMQQVSLGLRTNPQDVINHEGFFYISSLQKPYLMKFDEEANSVVRTIDLSSFADSDGSPEATYLAERDGLLWVQLQRLNQFNSFAPENKSMVVRIDLEFETILDSLELKAANPVTPFKKSWDSDFLIGEAGFIGSKSQLDGGIEKINSKTLESLGFISTEALLGGDIIDFECVNQQVCVAIISKPYTELVLFSPRSGLRLETLWRSRGYDLKQLVWDSERNLLYVADGNQSEPMIRVWEGKTWIQQWDLNWRMELPPHQMRLVQF